MTPRSVPRPQAGIGIDLDLMGRAPLWAMPRNAPAVGQASVYPSASAYGSVRPGCGQALQRDVHARAAPRRRCPGSASGRSGTSRTTRPRCSRRDRAKAGHPDLPPHVPRPRRRRLEGPNASGHGHDTILIGELAPRGYPHTSVRRMFPVLFVQSLYCVDSNYRPLSGSTARAEGCPTNAAGTRSFAPQTPACSTPTASPTTRTCGGIRRTRSSTSACKTGLCASLARLRQPHRGARPLDARLRLEQEVLDLRDRVRLPDEPAEAALQQEGQGIRVPTATAAMYLNWAEYLSCKNPRIASYRPVPAGRSRRRRRRTTTIRTRAASSSRTASRSRATTRSGCRCTCRRAAPAWPEPRGVGLRPAGAVRVARHRRRPPDGRDPVRAQGLEHVHDALDGDDHEPRGLLRHPRRRSPAAARSGCSTPTRATDCCSRRGPRSTAAT